MTVDESTGEEARRMWEHRPGDRYVIIVAHVIGNEADGFHIHRDLYTPAVGSVDVAVRQGPKAFDHDDFNIGVLRHVGKDGERLVAILWMHEIVDDDPALMAEIAEQVGL